MIGWMGNTEGSFRYDLAKKQFPDMETITDLASSSAEAILFSEDYFPDSLKQAHSLNQDMTFIQFADGFLRQDDVLIPKCSYLTSFKEKFSALSKYIDTSKGVMIAGDFHPARAAVLSLYKIGFRDFYLLEDDNKDHWLRRAQAGLFGIKVQSVNMRELVNLSGDTSVLIHGVFNTDQVVAEWELSYLNFLNRPGLIIDFLTASFLAKVVEETRDKDLYLFGHEEIEADSLEWWKIKTTA